jgi:hypothetical protein
MDEATLGHKMLSRPAQEQKFLIRSSLFQNYYGSWKSLGFDVSLSFQVDDGIHASCHSDSSMRHLRHCRRFAQASFDFT